MLLLHHNLRHAHASARSPVCGPDAPPPALADLVYHSARRPRSASLLRHVAPHRPAQLASDAMKHLKPQCATPPASLAFAASHGRLFWTHSQPTALRTSFHARRVSRLSDARWTSQPGRRRNRALVIHAQRSALPTTAVQAPPELAPQRTAERRRELEQPTRPAQPARYRVRQVDLNEVYTVADIRCEAFYEHPKDPYFYPVRRREIYMAMRDRLESGNKCLVVVDTQPPAEWLEFATDGELVVGSLDISLHEPATGRKCRFLNTIFDTSGNNNKRENDGNPKRIYISSMAVREGWRGRGLAQLLLVYVDNIALQQGSKEVFLHVELDNKAAVHVYTKCGFQIVEEDTLLRLPKWLHFITKAEHTLMQKKLD